MDVGWSISGSAPFPVIVYRHISGGLWAHLLDLMASGLESKEASQEHITVLYMRAVNLALVAFPPQLVGQYVVLMSEQRIRCRLSLTSRWHCVSEIMPDGVHHHSVTKRHSIWLEARCIPGKKNVLTDQISSVRVVPYCLECSRRFAGSSSELTLGPAQSYRFTCHQFWIL